MNPLGGRSLLAGDSVARVSRPVMRPSGPFRLLLAAHATEPFPLSSTNVTWHLDFHWIEVGPGPQGPAAGGRQTKTVGPGGPDATFQSPFFTSHWSSSVKLCDSSVTSVSPVMAAVRPNAPVTLVGRLLLLAALATAGIPASAQLIPWSEPPAALTPPASVPPPAPAPPRVTTPTAKKSTATAALTASPNIATAAAPALAATEPSLVTLLLSSFNGAPADGATLTNSSWVGQVTQNTGTITVAGTAVDDNGWGARGLSLNTSAMNFLEITAQRDTGNLAPTLFFQFEDQSIRTRVLSLSTSLFAIGTPTTVHVALPSWTIDFGSNAIAGWSLGGGGVSSSDTTVAFRMTFDQIAFTSAIPEPSTYAALLGLVTLGAVVYRRRRKA
jgi:hypothetical protein